MVQGNASSERWLQEVIALILSILSKRYWGIGNSLISSQKIFSTSCKLKIYCASERERDDGASYQR